MWKLTDDFAAIIRDNMILIENREIIGVTFAPEMKSKGEHHHSFTDTLKSLSFRVTSYVDHHDDAGAVPYSP
jgi:hypothetical protein